MSRRLFCLLLAVCSVQATSVAFAQLPRYWWSRGCGGGGAFFAPAISPADPNTLFVSTDMGTVFRSLNGGALWDSYPFGTLQGGRLAKVLFTADPEVLYALDGRMDYVTYNGANIFCSTDAGCSWARVPGDPTNGDATRKKLRADPGGFGRLILGHDSGLWFSANGGTNWTSFYAPGSGCYLANAYFSGANIFAAGNFGLYVSTNSGASFAAAPLTGIGAGQGIISFSGATQAGRTRLYCVTIDSGTASNATDDYPSPPESIYGNPAVYKGVYACDWPGGTWSRCANGISATDYPAMVATSTGRTDIVYLAGLNSQWGAPAIYRSDNAGTNWQSVFDPDQRQNAFTGWAGYDGDVGWWWGGAPLGFEVCPSDPNCAVFCDLGFVHGTTNAGAVWQALYVPPAERNPAYTTTPKHRAYHGIGLEDTACWWLAWLDSSRLLAGFSDIGALYSTNGGASWISAGAAVGNYNTIYCCITNGAGTAYAAAASVHCLYQSIDLTDGQIDGGNGEVLASADKGQSWQLVHNFNHPVVWLALHPTNANVMYASVVHSTAGGIFVTSNLLAGAASTWAPCASPPRTEGHPYSVQVLRDGTLICSYSGRLTTVFTHSSGVFVSTDGGAAWTDCSVPNMECWTKDLVVYPFDPGQNTWFAGVFEAWGADRPYQAGGLYRTTDRGQHWTAFTVAGWPSLYRVESIAFHPANTNFAWITTEDSGLLYSTNILAVTPVFLPATNYPFIHPTRLFTNPYDFGELWAASYGNGLRAGWLTEPRPLLAQLAVTNNVAGIRGSAHDGQRLILQGSTDLITWTDLATNLVINNCFSDTEAATNRVRFYRTKCASPAIGQN